MGHNYYNQAQRLKPQTHVKRDPRVETRKKQDHVLNLNCEGHALPYPSPVIVASRTYRRLRSPAFSPQLKLCYRSMMKNRSHRAILSTSQIAYQINASKLELVIFNPTYGLWFTLIEGKRIDRRGREEKRLSDEAERNADQRNRENPGEGPSSTPRRVTRRQSRTSLTGREDENAGGKADRPRREGASPETWTGRRTRNRLKGARKQTGEKERLHHISISVWGNEEEREIFIFVLHLIISHNFILVYLYLNELVLIIKLKFIINFVNINQAEQI